MANSSGVVYGTFPESKTAVIGALPISFCGIILNALFINAHLRDPLKILRYAAAMFIANIVFVNFLASCLFFVHSLMVLILFEVPHIADEAMQFLLWAIHSVCTTAYVIFLLGLSVERFISLAFPLWHRVKATPRACCYWLAVIWTLILCYELTILVCYFTRELRPSFWMAIARSVASLTVFLVICLLNIGSYFSLKRQRKQLYKRQDIGEACLKMMQIRLEAEQNFLKTVLIVCLMLMLTLLPVLVHILVVTLRKSYSKANHRHFLSALPLTVVPLNYAVNSLVYLRCPKYRETYKKLYPVFKHICKS